MIRIPMIAGKNIEYFLLYTYAVREVLKCVCSGVKITCPVLCCAWWMEWVWRLTILFIWSPDDDPLGSKHVGQFLCNKNHLCICWCIT
jgi:hypothetical protein